jgi:hypothetical protein
MVDVVATLGYGQTGAVEFMDADKAVAVPNGDIAFELYAPAAYMETINTTGQEVYAKSELKKFNVGIDIEVQTSPIMGFTRNAFVTLTKS